MVRMVVMGNNGRGWGKDEENGRGIAVMEGVRD